jgi:hypothetical protein
MKTLFLSTVLLFTGVLAKAQLQNTKWTGVMRIPDETKVILEFKTDTVNMIVVEQGMVGETMTFAVKDSIISLAKTSGNSPCNPGDAFKIKFSIKGDQLFLSNITDPCDARAQAWTDQPLTRVKS